MKGSWAPHRFVVGKTGASCIKFVWQWSGIVVAHIQRILSLSALATSGDIGFVEPRIVAAHDGYSSKAKVSIGNAMRSELSAQPLEKEKTLYTRHLRLRQKGDRGSRL